MSDEEQINQQSGLTPSEEHIMGLLVRAWNAWNQQPDVVTTQEMQQFVNGIHMAQEALAARALTRAYPDYWTDPQQTGVAIPSVLRRSGSLVANAVITEIDRRVQDTLPRKTSWGILADLGPAPSAEDIAEMRREAEKRQ